MGNSNARWVKLPVCFLVCADQWGPAREPQARGSTTLICESPPEAETGPTSAATRRIHLPRCASLLQKDRRVATLLALLGAALIAYVWFSGWDSFTQSVTDRGGWGERHGAGCRQLRNDVVAPVVAQRLPQIVQGGSKKSQKNSLQLSVQARPRPAHTDLS
jgi:hypothetical protein